MKISLKIVTLVIACSCVFFLESKAKAIDPNTCYGVQDDKCSLVLIEDIVTDNPNDRVYITTSADESGLYVETGDCNPNPTGTLKLLMTNDLFKEIMSMLISAQIFQRKVTIYLNGSCEITNIKLVNP